MPYVNGRYRLRHDPSLETPSPTTCAFYLLAGRFWNATAYRRDGEEERAVEWRKKAERPAGFLRQMAGEAAAAIGKAAITAKRQLAEDQEHRPETWRAEKGEEWRCC